MIIWAWIDAIFFWIMGVLLFIHLVKWKNKEKKNKDKYSEILESILFILIGFYVLNMIPNTSFAQKSFYIIHIISFSVLTIFFLGLNVLPNYFRVKKNPDYRKEITYAKFLKSLDEKYTSEKEREKVDKFKDLTRKLLHIIQFFGVLGLHFISIYVVGKNDNWGISYLEFRNFIYILISGFFWIMILTGDLTRINNWRYLPKWGMVWFEKSLEPIKERWTLNAVTPILLANLTWIHPIFPTQVLFSAVWVSCIGDAIASIIGKNFGKKKLKIGYYPEKTLEGLITGILTSFSGIFLIFIIFPIGGLPIYAIFLISFMSGLVFALSDLFIKIFCDNLVNGLLTGFSTWILILLFI